MKILHIVGDSKFGGGSVIVWRLAELARKLGWEVDVLTTDPTFQELLRASGIGVVNLEVIWREIRPLRDWQGLRTLTSFLKESNYQIVHTHTSKGGFVGRAAAARARVPIVVHTVHGFAFHEESSPIAVKFYACLERLAARWCDRVVTVSEFHRQWAIRLGIGDSSKVVAIPNGIPEERLRATRSRDEIRGDWGVQQGEVVLLSTGRLAKQKGLEYLIRAVALLNDSVRLPFKVKAVLAGEGPLRTQLGVLAKRLGVSERILFLGFQDKVGDLLNASDIVVLPSLWEGLSVSLLEAMAAGKPIITTLIGSNREVTLNGEAALLVPPKDPLALADAIQRFIEHPDLAEARGRKAREVYAVKYREEQMLKSYQQLYESLIATKMMPY